MKTKILLLFLFWTGVSFAQIQKDEILKEAEANIIKKGKEIDSINEKIKTLNKLLENATVNINQKISGLKEKLDLIEQSQMKMQEREVEIYQSNFYASLFSLHKINQDIDKLKLVNSTKKFYSKLKDVENPMRYSEFNTWLIDFKKYIEKKKKKEANLYLLDLIFKENSVGGLIGSSVPFLNYLTEGVASYINTLADENTNDIQKGQKMLAFILKLEKFSYGNINNNELLSDNRFMELKTLYNEILLSQLTLIGENKDHFLTNRNGDPTSEVQYLKGIEQKTKSFIEDLKKKDSKNWKSHINKHLYVTQSFNTDFASLLLKIKEEMDGYIKILDSYKDDEILKNNITAIKKDLEDMKSDFEIAYLPKQYLLNVNKMYLTP